MVGTQREGSSSVRRTEELCSVLCTLHVQYVHVFMVSSQMLARGISQGFPAVGIPHSTFSYVMT